MRIVEFGLVQEILDVHAVFFTLARPVFRFHVPDFARVNALDGSAALVANVLDLALAFKVERSVLSRVFTIGANAHIEAIQQLFLFPAEERPRRRIQVEVRNPVESARRNFRIVVFFAVRSKECADTVRPFHGNVVLEFEPFEKAKSAGFGHTT